MVDFHALKLFQFEIWFTTLYLFLRYLSLNASHRVHNYSVCCRYIMLDMMSHNGFYLGFCCFVAGIFLWLKYSNSSQYLLSDWCCYFDLLQKSFYSEREAIQPHVTIARWVLWLLSNYYHPQHQWAKISKQIPPSIWMVLQRSPMWWNLSVTSLYGIKHNYGAALK